MTETIEDTLGAAEIFLEEYDHVGPARRKCPTLQIKQCYDIINVEPSQARALATALHKFAAKYDE
jgi:hypothetical protein